MDTTSYRVTSHDEKVQLIEVANKLFTSLVQNPTLYEIRDLAKILETITPTHALLDISDTQTVDAFLSLYPYLYQRCMPVYGYFIYMSRGEGFDKYALGEHRSYRDYWELYIKSVKLLYESLSRRITVMFGRHE